MNDQELRKLVREELHSHNVPATATAKYARFEVFKVLVTPITVAIVGAIVSWIISGAERNTSLAIAGLQVDTAR